MPQPSPATTGRRRPSLQELGVDLVRVSPLRRTVSLALPFGYAIGYFILAIQGWWVPAVLCLMALSFVTYGSVSHDLVHRSLGLNRRANDVLLTLIELLALRSGTAYRLSHLHHHRRYPAEDDIEAAAAGMTLWGALVEGVKFQLKIFVWAWRQYPARRNRLALEGGLIATLYGTGGLLLPWTPVPFLYALLMTTGAWVIPLITSYLPHDPHAEDELHQTRAYRGTVFSILAFQHLYHLEHHLYPAVPHHHWPELARRLDPFLQRSGVVPLRLWF